MTDQGIIDNRNQYFGMIPNIAEDELVDPYLFRLYSHYVRIGKCNEATKTTAKKTGMSERKVRECRLELAERGYINLKQDIKDNGDFGSVIVTINDVMGANVYWCKYIKGTSQDNVSNPLQWVLHQMQKGTAFNAMGTAPDAVKEDQSKKIKNKKNKESPSTNIAQEDSSPMYDQPSLPACLPDEKASVSEIEMLLSQAGVEPQSWKFATQNDWTADELAILIEKSKQPSLTNPPGWIVKQLKDEQAHKLAQIEHVARQQAREEIPVAVASSSTGVNLWGYKINNKVSGEFDPIVCGWDKKLSVKESWIGTLSALELQLHRATYNSWIKDLRVLAYENLNEKPVLTLVAHTRNAHEWISQRLRWLIEGLCKQSFGDVNLRIIAPDDVEIVRIEIEQRIAALPVQPVVEEPPAQEVEPVTIPMTEESTARKNGYRDPASLSPEHIWKNIKHGLKFSDLNRQEYETYIERIEIVGYCDHTIYLKCSDYQRKEVNHNLRDKFMRRVKKVAGDVWKIKMVLASELEILPDGFVKAELGGHP